jgi:hypothetical protein
MQSEMSQLAAEIFRDGIQVLKGLLKEFKLKIQEMRGGGRT